jgi:uncharacterized protein (PEP-CTERM system associated)
MASSKATEACSRTGRVLLGLLSAAMAASVLAQTPGDLPDLGQSRDTRTAAGDQGGGTPKRAWTITPSIGLVETFTDNVDLSSADEEGDLITEIRPGIRVRGDTARLKFNADYSLRGIFYAGNSDENEVQHDLNAFGTLEAVEKWLYVDMSGVMTQEIISAFGRQSPDSSSINPNSTQTSNFRISPYIRGVLGGYADYDLRYSRSWMNAEGSELYDTDIEEWTGALRGGTRFAKLGWILDGSMQNYAYSANRNYESERLRAMLTYQYDPTLSISLSYGREQNDITSLNKETYNNPGAGFDWRPNPRTQLSVFYEDRFFGGNGHNIKFSHRMPLSAIQFTDSRDMSTLPNQLTTVSLGNIYDLVSATLSSKYPDPAVWEPKVDKFFADNPAISPTTQVTTGFLASEQRVERRQELSYLIRGTRNTLTLSISRSNSEKLTDSVLGDDFDLHTEIKSQGVGVTWSHRMSPHSSLSASATYNESEGDRNSGGTDESSYTWLTVSYSTRLGARSQASLAVRRTDFDNKVGSFSSDYTEHAVVGTLSMTF